MANVTVNIGDPLIIVLKMKKNQEDVSLGGWSVAYKLLSPANTDSEHDFTVSTEGDAITMSLSDTSNLSPGFNVMHIKLTSPTNVILRYKVNVKVTRAVI
jgi:hypothetical protein